tara:strand:+ start:597 stop:764 length:168 start_codon:yes stop_codon:yes gene_type:complete
MIMQISRKELELEPFKRLKHKWNLESRDFIGDLKEKIIKENEKKRIYETKTSQTD